MKRLVFISIIGLLASSVTHAVELKYPSGNVRLYQRSPKSALKTPDTLLRTAFALPGDGYEWRLLRELKTRTHNHRRYQLYVGESPVLFHHLDLHVGRQGFVDYATSTFEFPFDPPEGYRSRLSPESVRSILRGRYGTADRSFDGRIEVAPAIYNSEGNAFYVYESHVFGRVPRSHFHVVIDAITGDNLLSLKTMRNYSHGVYPVSPKATAAPTSVAIPGVTSVLSDGSILNVRREYNQSATAYSLSEIDGSSDFTNDGFNFTAASHDFDDNDFSCANATTTGCPNQGFDGVNVYYHIKTFRTQLDTFLSALGESPSLNLDPMDVTINTRSINVNGDTDGLGGMDEANNAFYATVLDVTGVVRSGLFFLLPARLSATSSICASANLKDLAREALVIVHEYQHYITDKITGMIAGSVGSYNIGDTLHEAYSDYMAASHISAENGAITADTTTIGAFAFENCPQLQRNIANKLPFSNTIGSTVDEDFSDPHTSGWTFASGLWSLRQDTGLGREAADKLALKSLFFLSTKPGFIEAVESLVLADESLNAGANVSTIRALFYDELKFTGTTNLSFIKDRTKFLLDAGFSSCLSVGMGTQGAGGSLFLGLLWLTTTLGLGRWRWR